MATIVPALRAHCPLCGSPVLSVSRNGRAFEDAIHPIRMALDLGLGYTLCDACGMLADMPSDLTLN
jgi:hypothetical protein